MSNDCAAELRGILSVCECVFVRVSRVIMVNAKFHTLHKAMRTRHKTRP